MHCATSGSPASAVTAIGIRGDDVVRVGDLDLRDVRRDIFGDVGHVDDAGVGFTELDLRDHGLHVGFFRDEVREHRLGEVRAVCRIGGELVERLAGVAPDRHVRSSEHQPQAVLREILRCVHGARIVRGHDDDEVVAHERLARIDDELLFQRCVHVGLSCRSEDVGAGALLELRDERGTTGEVERDACLGVRGLEVGTQLVERVGEGGGRKHGDIAGEVRSWRCRGRGRRRRWLAVFIIVVVSAGDGERKRDGSEQGQQQFPDGVCVSHPMLLLRESCRCAKPRSGGALSRSRCSRSRVARRGWRARSRCAARRAALQ